MPSKRAVLALLLGLSAAALFVRLGFWQLDRLHWRRLENALKVARLSAPPAPQDVVLAGTRRWRRVTITGTFDFAHQKVLTGRAFSGSPGVYVVTPMLPDSEPQRLPYRPPQRAVLVNRGWLYTPDAQRVDLTKAGEAPHQTVTGYVEEFALGGPGSAEAASTPDAWRRLERGKIEAAFPYPVAPFYLVIQSDSGVIAPPEAPVRLPLPEIDDGPHRNYAFQWFAFAVIAVVGASIIVYRDIKGPGPA